MIASFSRNNHAKGQGLVEYAIILVLVSFGTITALMILGPRIGNVFSTINSSLSTIINVEQPTPTPVPTWTKCADENGFCSFSGTAPVKYGANIYWVTLTFTNGVGCNNSVFGDPIYGTVKACYVFQ